MWFEKLVGFKEVCPEQVRENIEIIDNKLISKINNREFIFGKLEIPSLEELRKQNNTVENYHSEIKISEVVGNIQDIHTKKSNNGASIQVASQFNLLEMINPDRTPEDGVGIYEYDATQGPACAVACGAGTIYRNYFVKVNGQTGQTASVQVDCLKDIGKELENDKYHHWKMKNGYALATEEGLQNINNKLSGLTENEYEYLKSKLRTGVQQESEVTICNHKNLITQVYCSAVPVAYSDINKELWKNFATLILEAAYEATFYIALKNYEKTKNNKLFLTLLGGGAFGNDKKWIFGAIEKSIKKFANTPLDVKIVSYGASNYYVRQFIDSVNQKK